MIKKLLRGLYSRSKWTRYYWMKYTWNKANKNVSKISDIEFAKQYYFKCCGKELNLENPVTYDDKVWWLKLNNRDPLITRCSDKYLVREYVKECGLGNILTQIYGVYDDVKNIDFNEFKEPVFLKSNHTSGFNRIYYPNKYFDKNDFIRTFNFILKNNYYIHSREWNYKDIKPKIVAEEVLYDENGNLPIDYKFLCFRGEPKLLYLMIGTCNEEGQHANKEQRFMNVYDMDFKLTNITQGYPIYTEKEIDKPALFEEMKDYARILSKPFEFSRVDFYQVKGKIYFGEITFYDGGGCNNTQPFEWDLKMGSWIDINNIKKV